MRYKKTDCRRHQILRYINTDIFLESFLNNAGVYERIEQYPRSKNSVNTYQCALIILITISSISLTILSLKKELDRYRYWKCENYNFLEYVWQT